VEAVEHLRLFPARTFARPGADVERRASQHLIIGTRSRDRTAARGGPAVSSIGLVARGSPRDLTRLATAEPAAPGAPTTSLDQKTFSHAPRRVGKNRSVRSSAANPLQSGWRDRRELRCGATIRARPAPAPAGSACPMRAGKEFATFGTRAGRAAAAMRPASTRT